MGCWQRGVPLMVSFHRWGVAEANAIGLVACSAGMLVLRSLSFISFRCFQVAEVSIEVQV
jgi:hypothetical protein